MPEGTKAVAEICTAFFRPDIHSFSCSGPNQIGIGAERPGDDAGCILDSGPPFVRFK